MKSTAPLADAGATSPVTDAAPRSLWFLMPIVLLGGLLSILGTMIAVATNDDGFAVEPDYYLKATRWDADSRAREASRQLGWSHRVALHKEDRNTRVEVSLSDASGAPVAGADVTVEAFPNAHAAELHRPSLREEAPGRYVGDFVNTRAGFWEVRIDARAPNGERYLGTARLDVTLEPR